MPDRPTSSFSRAMAAALRGYMRERDISQRALAERIERSEGFVSEHLNGHRAPDTDMIDAVAGLAHISTPRLHEELIRRVLDLPPDPPAAVAERLAEQARADAAPPPGDVNADNGLTKKRRGRGGGA